MNAKQALEYTDKEKDDLDYVLLRITEEAFEGYNFLDDVLPSGSNASAVAKALEELGYQVSHYDRAIEVSWGEQQ